MIAVMDRRKTSPCSGWARPMRRRPPSSCSASRPRRARPSSDGIAPPAAPRRSTSIGSPRATSSITARSSAARSPRRASTSSMSRGGLARRCSRRQIVPSWPRTPESRAPSSSSRTNRALPWLASQNSRRVTPSTRPPRTTVSSSSTWSGIKAPMSSRSTARSFHSAVTGSGADSPVRTVSMTEQRPDVTRWLTTVAEASSSRWASSTASRRRRPSSRGAPMAAATPRRTSPATSPVLSNGSSGANAPSGICDEERVARTCSTWKP